MNQYDRFKYDIVCKILVNEPLINWWTEIWILLGFDESWINQYNVEYKWEDQ